MKLDNLDKHFANISSAEEEEANHESNEDAQEDETSEFWLIIFVYHEWSLTSMSSNGCGLGQEAFKWTY